MTRPYLSSTLANPRVNWSPTQSWISPSSLSSSSSSQVATLWKWLWTRSVGVIRQLPRDTALPHTSSHTLSFSPREFSLSPNGFLFGSGGFSLSPNGFLFISGGFSLSLVLGRSGNTDGKLPHMFFAHTFIQPKSIFAWPQNNFHPASAHGIFTRTQKFWHYSLSFVSLHTALPQKPSHTLTFGQTVFLLSRNGFSLDSEGFHSGPEKFSLSLVSFGPRVFSLGRFHNV